MTGGSSKGIFGFKAWEFDLALRYLRTRRKDGGIAVIAIISYLGIAMAVTALVSVLSVMNGFRDELMSRVLAFNGHAYIYGAPLLDFASRDDMLKRVRGLPGVIEATPFIDSPGLAQGNLGTSGLAYMRGIEPDAMRHTDIVAQNLRDGSLSTFGQGEFGGDYVLIGDGLAASLGLRAGDEITLMSPGGSTAFGAMPRRKVYLVGAVFKSGVSEIDRSFIYMPITQAQLFFDREEEWDAVEIKVKDPYRIAKYHDPILSAAGPGALFEDWTVRNAPLWGALSVERWAMRFILFFLVIIATLNIISGVVMLVKNKTRDVAILRTMGADRSSIARVFFFVGVMIGTAGTATGLALGVLFCASIRQIQQAIEFIFQVKIFDPTIYYLSYVPAKMELSEVAFVALGSLTAACLCTLFPALWASKLEPVEALRYE